MQAPSIKGIIEKTPTGIFHRGNWKAGDKTFSVVDPATALPLVEVADASATDARAALDAISEAAPTWAATPVRERADLLWEAWHKLMSQSEYFANLITLELGKPLDQSLAEVNYGGSFLRWFAESAPHLTGRYSTLPEGNLRGLVSRRPVGPCLLITPWNFPLAMATRKLAPALAAGCTAIIKPAHQTPLTTLAFVEVLRSVGLPAGVVEALPGTDAAAVSETVMADSRLRKVSFTGSTRVGQLLLKQAAPQVLRSSMELGGCAPFIVFEDADMKVALDAAMMTKLRNMGQACNASSRFYVHSSRYDEFLAGLTERFAGLKVGNGREPGVDVGPLVSEEHLHKVSGLVEQALSEGGRIVTGGHRLDGPGYFYAPTIIEVSPDSVLMREEIFGPVIPICRFETEEEVLAWANDVPFGLAGYAYTRDMKRALSLSERLEVGMISVNAGTNSNTALPFGGVKASGLGREGSHEGIDEYLETVYLTLPV